MELAPLTLHASPSFPKDVPSYKVRCANDLYFRSMLLYSNSHKRGQKKCFLSSALPETAASVLIASVAVGAAATLLARNIKKASQTTTISLKVCEDCGGSGICAECNGEGFILKKISDESAEKARMAAKNMATRYTAGLPKKWTYCSKCSSARSCSTCGGSGRIGWHACSSRTANFSYVSSYSLSLDDLKGIYRQIFTTDDSQRLLL